MSVELIGVSPNIIKIRKIIDKVADTGINLIVCGETGVGKEVVAKQLYRRSNRNSKPFVVVNCAALPDTLLESEMFGYEKGAFTGAQRRMRGKFELADGGVLFLDEIGDMSPALQSKLLHSLQDGEFHRLGSEQGVKTDAWVIAATNHNLVADVKAGKFRQDLYQRISVMMIYVEPLRKRPEDIPHLIDYYCAKYKTQLKRRPYRPLSKAVIEKLTLYHWPGNVRELQNVLKRLIIVGEPESTVDDMIASAKIRDSATETKSLWVNPQSQMEDLGLSDGGLGDLANISFRNIRKRAADLAEKQVILYVLAKTGWNRSKAARILGVSYKTLHCRIQHLGIRPPSSDHR
jgi:two-component system response regulator AtoC